MSFSTITITPKDIETESFGKGEKKESGFWSRFKDGARGAGSWLADNGAKIGKGATILGVGALSYVGASSLFGGKSASEEREVSISESTGTDLALREIDTDLAVIGTDSLSSLSLTTLESSSSLSSSEPSLFESDSEIDSKTSTTLISESLSSPTLSSSDTLAGLETFGIEATDTSLDLEYRRKEKISSEISKTESLKKSEEIKVFPDKTPELESSISEEVASCSDDSSKIARESSKGSSLTNCKCKLTLTDG